MGQTAYLLANHHKIKPFIKVTQRIHVWNFNLHLPLKNNYINVGEYTIRGSCG